MEEMNRQAYEKGEEVKTNEVLMDFTIKSTYSEKFLLKYAWASTLKFPIILFHIIAMLAFIGIGIYYLISGSTTYMGIVLPVFGVILIPGMIFIANISMAKTMKKEYEKYGLIGDFVVDYVFLDKIVMNNSCTKMVSIIDYSELKKCYKSLGLIIIETAKGFRIILDQKGFLKGDKENFIIEIKKIIKQNKNVKDNQ